MVELCVTTTLVAELLDMERRHENVRKLGKGGKERERGREAGREGGRQGGEGGRGEGGREGGKERERGRELFTLYSLPPSLFLPSLLPSPSTVCSTLSVVGFIFAICVASTVAAQGGAVAGLGIALLSKPILFEVRAQCSVQFMMCSTCTHKKY